MDTEKEVSAVTKTYDLLLWLLPHVADFPRAHRFTRGDRLEAGAIAVLKLLVEASYVSRKSELLRKANVRLEGVRYLVRLSKDLGILSVRRYEFAARAIAAIGVEVSAWERYQASRSPEL